MMRMKRKGWTSKILVAMRIAYGSGRDVLYGIAGYARLHCRWRLRIVNIIDDETFHEFCRAEAEEADGIIACGLERPAILCASHTPLVCICARTSDLGQRKDAVAFVNNDDVAIGHAGAKYLASLGRFRSYGFISRSENEYSYVHTFREQGFRKFFADRTDDDVRTYQTAAGVKRGSLVDVTALSVWLKALPKPAAVMASHDLRAMHAIEAADMANIRIPQELVVIGVDNDELYCETSVPTITSIAPNHVRLGELAAKELKRLMTVSRRSQKASAGKAAESPPVISLTSHKIIERQSSRSIPPASQLVEHAIAFIRQNSTKGIGAFDVAAHLGVSRRLADLRFRQMTGKSILGAILDRRFDELKRHLRDSDVSIEKLITACGFKTISNAKNLFKKRYGVSMREYRRTAANAALCKLELPQKAER